mgnify:CR=1 FL=1
MRIFRIVAGEVLIVIVVVIVVVIVGEFVILSEAKDLVSRCKCSREMIKSTALIDDGDLAFSFAEVFSFRASLKYFVLTFLVDLISIR